MKIGGTQGWITNQNFPSYHYLYSSELMRDWKFEEHVHETGKRLGSSRPNERYKLRNVTLPKILKATKEVLEPGFRDAFPKAKGSFLAVYKSCAKAFIDVATRTSPLGRYLVEMDEGYTRFVYLRGCAARFPFFSITIGPMNRWMGFRHSSPASGYISTFDLHFAPVLARQSVEGNP